MGNKKKKIAVKAHVGEQEITLSDGLISVIHAEVISQLGDDLSEMDFEVVIEVSHEIDVIIDEETKPLSGFNNKLKQALGYNPKANKE